MKKLFNLFLITLKSRITYLFGWFKTSIGNLTGISKKEEEKFFEGINEKI